MAHAPRAVALAAGGLLFLVLATANGGGYRYGVSDQAFWIPAAVRALEPSAFPRDGALVDAQARLLVFDEAIAAVVAVTGAPLEAVFLAGYLACFALLWTGVVLVGARIFRTPWGIVAFGALVTLRHRIPRTSANSIEPYFYPRMLAFAIGLLAVAAVLRRRPWMALAASVVAMLVHPTTGLWFGVLAGVAALSLDVRWRRWSLACAVAAAVVAIGGIAAGPLAAAVEPMDDAWVATLASKDSLFPTEWPAWAWAANLLLPVLLVRVHRLRAGRGNATREDAALVHGALALTAVFLLSVPVVHLRWTLPTQLQIARVFWPIDLLAGLYLLAFVFERAPSWSARAAPSVLTSTLVALSIVRGGYIMLVEFPDRPLFAVGLQPSPWHEAMAWLRAQPADAHVFADPGHAWRYGTSVRVAAGRDVFLEETKDSAVAIYSRAVAARVAERMALLAAHGNRLDLPLVRILRERYGVDFIVTEEELPLAAAYRNATFRIYDVARTDLQGP